MTRASTHFRLLALGVAVWLAFWLIGLPDYYQQYSFTLQLVATVLLIPAFAFAGGRSLLRAKRERRFMLSVWFSFYFTVPFALLDTLYCGLYLGHGTAFFTRYWYLTIFYFLPWMIFPPIGWWSSQASRGE